MFAVLMIIVHFFYKSQHISDEASVFDPYSLENYFQTYA